jgi:hypothetical protein
MVQAGHGLPPRRGLLRTATEPLTAREIAERVLEAAKIAKPDKAALDDLIGTVLASQRNQGKGVERTNEGSPARCRLSTCLYRHNPTANNLICLKEQHEPDNDCPDKTHNND